MVNMALSQLFIICVVAVKVEMSRCFFMKVGHLICFLCSGIEKM